MPWHPLWCYLLSFPHPLSIVDLAACCCRCSCDCGVVCVPIVPLWRVGQPSAVLLLHHCDVLAPASPFVRIIHVAAYSLIPRSRSWVLGGWRCRAIGRSLLARRCRLKGRAAAAVFSLLRACLPSDVELVE